MDNQQLDIVRSAQESLGEYGGEQALHYSCVRCKRPLKNPRWQAIGYGPVCARRAGISVTRARPSRASRITAALVTGPTLGDDQLTYPSAGPQQDVVLRLIRTNPDERGIVETNVPVLLPVLHSPTGLSWGYLGSGCAELARQILAAYGLPVVEIDRCYQSFKEDLIAPLPEEGGVIPAQVIKDWITAHRTPGGQA